MIIFGGKLKLTFACVMHVTRKFHAEMTFNFPCPKVWTDFREFPPYSLGTPQVDPKLSSNHS